MPDHDRRLDLGQAETFRKAAGGAPANVAVGLARLGVASAFMGKVGEDGFGRFLAATLAEAGVDVVAAAVRPARADRARLRLARRRRRPRVPVLPRPRRRHAVRARREWTRPTIGRRQAAAFRLDQPDRRAVPRRPRCTRSPWPGSHGVRLSYDPNLPRGAVAQPRRGPRRAAARLASRRDRQDQRGGGASS